MHSAWCVPVRVTAINKQHIDTWRLEGGFYAKRNPSRNGSRKDISRHSLRGSAWNCDTRLFGMDINCQNYGELRVCWIYRVLPIQIEISQIGSPGGQNVGTPCESLSRPLMASNRPYWFKIQFLVKYWIIVYFLYISCIPYRENCFLMAINRS